MSRPSGAALERTARLRHALLGSDPMTRAELRAATQPMTSADFESALKRLRGAKMVTFTGREPRRVTLTMFGEQVAVRDLDGDVRRLHRRVS